MKTTLFFLLFLAAFIVLCLVQPVSAQYSDPSAHALPERVGKAVAAKTRTRNAGFPGLSKFLRDSLEYPELARKNGIEGSVVVEVTIGTDGSVLSPAIRKSLGFGCDEAVLALFSKMPKWEPALQNENAIEQKVLVPVRFALQ